MSLTETPPLQLILPTDKRNPSLSLYLSADERAIHVFYGLELLVAVVQAYVFTILTCVYLRDAVGGAHH